MLSHNNLGDLIFVKGKDGQKYGVHSYICPGL